jgi:hypothetical protein
LIEFNDVPAPPDPNRLAGLTPWATGLRYGEDPVEPGPLDREAALKLISAAGEWARRLLC